MTFDDYQRSALRTTNPALTSSERLIDAAAGLAEESGELLGLVRKQALQQRSAPPERFVEELGDVLWCVAVTAGPLGAALESPAGAKPPKLRPRPPRRCLPAA